MSGWVAVGAMALTVLVGHDDITLGVVVVRVIAPNYACRSADSRKVNRLGARYELVLIRMHPASITRDDPCALASDARGLDGELQHLKFPKAAQRMRANLHSMITETETQLRQYAQGHDFDRTTVDALLPLAATANRARQ